MLTQEQIIHLLHRCEALAGAPLVQTRRRLCDDKKWLPACWELIVMEAAGQIGNVEYEPDTPGDRHPDFRLEFDGGGCVWLEAAFRLEAAENNITKDHKHPAHKILKKKENQARRSGVSGPIVVCIGTDRVQELGLEVGGLAVNREKAAMRLLGMADTLSGAIITSSLHEFVPFQGVVRKTHSWLYTHPRSKNPLPESLAAQLYRLDFGRWQRAMFTPKKSPVAGVLPIGRGSLVLPPISDSLLPPPIFVNQHPSYEYHWQFEHLVIIPMGSRFGLLHNNELINEANTPEILAEGASALFRVFPGNIIGPGGRIIPHPDPGVPSDLSKWTVVKP